MVVTERNQAWDLSYFPWWCVFDVKWLVLANQILGMLVGFVMLHSASFTIVSLVE